MSNSPTPSRTLLSRFAPLVRIAIGVSLLTLLFSKVPWNDRVALMAPDGTELSLEVGPAEVMSSDPGDRLLLIGVGDAEGWRFELAEEGSKLAVVAPPVDESERWQTAEGRYQPGIGGSLRKLSVLSFLIATLLAFMGTLAASLRWKVLLGAVDLRVPILRAVRLNLAGLAASQVLLGSVGGDIVKAALVGRDEAVPASLNARTQAVLALLMDRVIGLVALLSIGTAAAYMVDGNPGELAIWFTLALGALLVGVVGVLLVAGKFDFPSGSSAVWRVLHSLHAALAQYRRRPSALGIGLLLSFASHSFLIAAIALLGTALGMQVEAMRFFLLIPIIETAQAVPVSPAGWGVAESMYVILFQDAGETASMALTLALSVRAVTLTQALMGVPGLLVLLRQSRGQA